MTKDEKEQIDEIFVVFFIIEEKDSNNVWKII